MTTKIKTVRYANEPHSRYTKEKEEMIKEGWNVFEVNITEKHNYSGSMKIGTTVSGNIVYEKK